MFGFVGAVEVLALPADEQVKWLGRDDTPSSVSELVAEFHDGWHLIPQLLEADWMTSGDAKPLGVIVRSFRVSTSPAKRIFGQSTPWQVASGAKFEASPQRSWLGLLTLSTATGI